MPSLRSRPARRRALQVFNDFARRVGIGDGWAFTDVYGLDDELLAMVPQPCIAVVLLFPVNEVLARSEMQRRAQLARRPPRVSPRVFFMRQYIGNACGTVAAVHALLNNRERLAMSDGPLSSMAGSSEAESGPDSADGEETCGEDVRSSASALGEKLSQSEDLMRASETSARIGQTSTPDRGVDADYHYVCFVERDGELYELDGTKQMPVNHGPIQRGLLHDAARAIREHFVSKMPGGHFNVMALVADEDGSIAAARD